MSPRAICAVPGTAFWVRVLCPFLVRLAVCVDGATDRCGLSTAIDCTQAEFKTQSFAATRVHAFHAGSQHDSPFNEVSKYLALRRCFA
jgi:hypothetical protein